MPRTERWPERIGAVFLPAADTVEMPEDVAPRAEHPAPLTQGCYTLSLRWAAARRDAPALVGTLRVEPMPRGVRFSGDLYREQPTADLLADPRGVLGDLRSSSDEAADTGGRIPIYPRANYHSYLRGVRAELPSTVPGGSGDSVVLEFEEFVYNRVPEDFTGSFDQIPTRILRFVLAPTGSPDLFSGTAHAGASNLGTVSVRWVSPHFRQAHLQLHTLEGAIAPPAEVEGVTFAAIFADAGWELSITDPETFPIPAELSRVNINDCWSHAEMRTLLTLVPSFHPAELDSVWRVHLLAIPAKLGCQRGWMPEWVFVHDLSLSRVGALTYSHDGYPSAPVGDGPLDDQGSPHYDRAADLQQHQIPRAYLRSAAHELGHAFNQVHQESEAGEPDNSIMTTTPGVARFLGESGTFPDQINLAFNDRVKTHLRHLPDPAVRPGAMPAFVTAEGISRVPEPTDVVWLELLELSVELSSDRVALGEPTTLSWTLTNHGPNAVPAPAELAVESLVARVSVTDPTGRITFMRPAEVRSYPQVPIVSLDPGASVRGSTTLFWGWDGFAFQMPGRHLVEVIVLWELANMLVAVSGERDIFVSYPTSNEENEVAALLLHPDVGKAVAFGDLTPFERAAQQIKKAQESAPTHPANQALRRLGLGQQPR
jgi:hypothetical protein